MLTTGVKNLHITNQAGRHIIFLPTPKAKALRVYLQTKGITCSHPESVTGEMSSVEIRAKDDLALIQNMLDDWGQVPAKR